LFPKGCLDFPAYGLPGKASEGGKGKADNSPGISGILWAGTLYDFCGDIE